VKHIRTIIVSTAFLVPALACAGGDSSDGHTHGGAVPPEVIADVAPRTSAQSDEFELVAVLAEGKLTLYLDRYADNAPVPDAEVEVESGAFKAVAAQIAPGVYSVPGQVFAQPGKHPLTISVQAGDAADLLTATSTSLRRQPASSMPTAGASGRCGAPRACCCWPAPASSPYAAARRIANTKGWNRCHE
jgi:cobalt-zinc-cadmium efflux system membrane fusion protein